MVKEATSNEKSRPAMIAQLYAMFSCLPLVLTPHLLAAPPVDPGPAKTTIEGVKNHSVRFQPGTGILRLAMPEALPPGGDLTTGSVNTAIGTIQLNKDLPATPGDAAWIFRALDTQFATQAYLWALPIVAYAEWKEAQTSFGAGGTDLVVYSTYEEKLGILTANPTTAGFSRAEQEH